MEASGGYKRTAHRELLAQGVLAAIVNPKRVRDFARGMGLEAKTDRVDARLIARYGEVMRPAATPVPDPARTELGEILACRRQLIDAITVRQQQLEHLQSENMCTRATRCWPSCGQEERELTKLLRQKIEADRSLAADFALLTSMPGCGPILAATLLADMPELGALDRRQIAALAGLAPVAKDSGLRENRRVIKGGRGQVRRALDMAAVASLRISASPLQQRYDQLVANGKAPKLAPSTLAALGLPARRGTCSTIRRSTPRSLLHPQRHPAPNSGNPQNESEHPAQVHTVWVAAVPASSWRARSRKSDATTSNSASKPVS